MTFSSLACLAHMLACLRLLPLSMNLFLSVILPHHSSCLKSDHDELAARDNMFMCDDCEVRDESSMLFDPASYLLLHNVFNFVSQCLMTSASEIELLMKMFGDTCPS